MAFQSHQHIIWFTFYNVCTQYTPLMFYDGKRARWFRAFSRLMYFFIYVFTCCRVRRYRWRVNFHNAWCVCRRVCLLSELLSFQIMIISWRYERFTIFPHFFALTTARRTRKKMWVSSVMSCFDTHSFVCPRKVPGAYVKLHFPVWFRFNFHHRIN